MNSKSLLTVVFAACMLLGYGPVAFAQTDASAETEKRAEPTEADDDQEIEGSWFEGESAPEPDTAKEQRTQDKVMEDLDPVKPSETSPSPGQTRQENEKETFSAADRCLVSTIEAVLDVDRAGRGSELSINAKDGVVSLSGTLADQSIEQVRSRVARVKGVTRVDTSGLTTSATRPGKDSGKESSKEPAKE